MTLRTRKLIGTICTVLYLTVYALLAMMVGGILVVGRGWAAELCFYVIAGLSWLPGEMAIIRWMSKPDSVT